MGGVTETYQRRDGEVNTRVGCYNTVIPRTMPKIYRSELVVSSQYMYITEVSVRHTSSRSPDKLIIERVLVTSWSSYFDQLCNHSRFTTRITYTTLTGHSTDYDTD
ncbi:hypothetical protein BaRGS_00031649 [Batillaria attramentaria]|uniref:Uncharacterized protein n=1 Tax=Batillaria attramentaria TaxID=370345 RepID=A0ABD0JRE1_9CAEN